MSHLSSPEPDSSRLRLTTSLQNTSERNNIESSLYNELSCQGDELSMVSVASELDNAAEVARHRIVYGHGGTCIYVKSGLEYSDLNYMEDLSIGKQFECSGIKVRTKDYPLLVYYIDVAFPFETKIIGRHKVRKPWFTKGILVSNDRLHYLYKLSKAEDIFLKDYYRSYKRVYSRVLRAANDYIITN
nr:unnamed protein product [Callosobruchus chinensis]